jgi:3-oxoacyl-[acyl-carrier-protein] synthase-3
MPIPVITGTGMHVPDNVVKNDDLKAYYDTSDAWIRERSGIEERRWITEPTGPAELALPAAQQALAAAGLTKDDIDFVVFATLSPEAYFPGSGCFFGRAMDLGTTPCLDIRMQCSGFVYALSIAEMYIKQGMFRNVLVIGAEVQSTHIDYTPDGRTVGVLFGDGAGAVVVQAMDEAQANGRGIRSSHLHTQGEYIEKLWLPEPTSRVRPRITGDEKGMYAHMEGREVFKNAVVRMPEAVRAAAAANGWAIEDIDLVVPHQANLRISQFVAETLKLREDQVFNNIQKYGNTTAATIPIALYEAEQQGRLKPGDKVVVVAFGAGFTWGSVAMVW